MLRYHWEKLLSSARQRPSNINDERSEFDKDYDRVISSSSVRRLQAKTQVFPLQENDIARTRLTHSLEVSAIARSMGLRIGGWMACEQKHEFSENMKYNVSSILAVAGMIHDLGNPPFGHYGETVIREWFEGFFLKQPDILTKQQRNDFLLFDGNAQGLRIVSKLQFLNDEFGMNFTYGTLATMIKYPWSSLSPHAQASKKFGYFASEENLIDELYRKTGTGKDNYKHPLAYILEAADDITYLLGDIEDGVRKQLIPWAKEYSDFCEKYSESLQERIEAIEKHKNKSTPEPDINLVQNFKIQLQGELIERAIKCFKENYDMIMENRFDCGLLEATDEDKQLRKDLFDITRRYCFNSAEVLKLELSGETIINALLQEYVPAILHDDLENVKRHAGKLYQLISENFKYICIKKGKFLDLPIYDKIQLITDYISGMTDSYAVMLYRELKGLRLLKR